MIVQEHFFIGEHEYVRTYSDAGRFVLGGVPFGEYIEACDPAELGRTYTEGDPIPTDESEAEAILDILLGVET